MATSTYASRSAGRWGPLWGARAADWAEIEDQQAPTYEEAIRRIGIGVDRHVLDIGCGSGRFLQAAADRGARVSGLDASAALLEIAHTRVPGADLRLGDMENLPFADDAFDAVTGFNSFFFAADMVRALREAGRVARPAAPIVIQVWGRPERCDLTAMKGALARFLPAPGPGEPSPPALWEPGVLEGLAAAAGLTPVTAFDTAWAYEYPDEESLGRAMLAPGLVAEALARADEADVRTAIVAALAPFRMQGGGYRLENEWHYLIATR